MQYTVRGLPPALDAAIRERARAEGKSLNEVALEALAEGLGLGKDTIVYRDVADIAGSWKKDAAFDRAMKEQHKVDEDLWK